MREQRVHMDGNNQDMAIPPADVRLTEVLPGSPEARAVLRDYFRDIVSRSHAREATDGEVDAEMRGASPAARRPDRGPAAVRQERLPAGGPVQRRLGRRARGAVARQARVGGQAAGRL